jgi:hypothetical protein
LGDLSSLPVAPELAFVEYRASALRWRTGICSPQIVRLMVRVPLPGSVLTNRPFSLSRFRRVISLTASGSPVERPRSWAVL